MLPHAQPLSSSNLRAGPQWQRFILQSAREHDKNLLTARAIAKPCHRISNQGEDSAADIGAWIRQARARRDPAFATFAAGLDGDIAAMRAALTEPWSSGHAGGQINRLKLVKQLCYGRAGLEPLKRHMTLAA